MALGLVGLATGGSPVDDLDGPARIERLAELEPICNRPEWADPDAFFGPVSLPDPVVQSRGRRWGREVRDLSWDAGYTPIFDAHGDRYLSFEHNRRTALRWYASGDARPILICIHGYGGGEFWKEERAFPVRRWLKRGVDVVLFTLPFHGLRRAPHDKTRFPSAIPQVTIEGFRQGIGELRSLVAWLRASGAPHVSVVGMSLGGYTASLLATAEASLDAVGAFIPLASLADYAADRGRLVGTTQQQRTQREALERVYTWVSPLGRPSRVTPERMVVMGGRGDGITPIRHAERLSAHFDCELVRFPGGHLLQLGRRSAFSAFERHLPR